ncbi:predicted protein [Phaeodactylum tricornutum CCAP 1055/1]|jgi:prefoldin subunit 2|uniref:Prefoldin subunit 2 n=1 Tax=Phaeodactylum tricornutum (strain CCAP 1055/1) TaxID=556484 RepID=B7G3G4_PHATC|nr:predicted protein [Phaeodactylum tricornutum CCAP 1055/1]EEC46998.1 predicted protein [Phaeodactylum tricornutum CCAP 1055/1]|eukprot:XP_002181784.1 predicted protein [Phaeodactylum tricornutum CCAP 1055/1]
MASTHSHPQPPPQVVNQYNDLLRESQSLGNKISELEMDRNEHKLVEETLQPLEPDRRAYRLVGEVLVERTVKEVLPSVKTNRENLESTIATLKERLHDKQKEVAELKSKYNLQTEPSR